MAILMDGKALSKKIKENLAIEAQNLKANGVNPCLAVVIVGEDPASKV